MPRMVSFGLGRSKMLKCQRHNIEIEFVFYFLSAPNFAKMKRMEQAEDSSPDPSSSACEIQISRGFAKSLPPENSFGKTESALFRHLPETLRAEHQRKMSFPLSRKISPPPNQESKRHFSL